MHENLYLETYERDANIYQHYLDKIVEMEVFQLHSTTGYCDKHGMIEIITSSHRIATHELSVRLVFF